MNSDGDALFRAVCDQPWEDTPRLAYADWLEENGRPELAAYIRFECAFPAFTTSHPRYQELTERSLQFDSVWQQCESELPRFKGVKWWAGFFHRGFAHAATIHSSKAFRDHADAVFGAAPVDLLEVDQLTDRTVAHVLESRYLRRLKQLVLRGTYGNEGVRKIAVCAELPHLESLCVWGRCADAGAEALAASDRFPALRTLSFSNHALTNRGALALADSDSLRSVKRLVLHGTFGLSKRAVRRLKERFEELE